MMLLRPYSFCLVLVFLCPQIAFTQEVAASIDNVVLNAEYERAIRLKGIEADVQYFNPNASAPDFQTNEQPKPAEQPNASGQSTGQVNLPIALMAGAILLGVLFLFIRFGGAGSLVLRSEVKNPARARPKVGQAGKGALNDGQSFDSIVNNADRQQALINMAQLLIYKAVTANDLLLQRSWTARDVLRRMPKNSTYLPELSALVLQGELVHFGERDVSEEEFANFAARAKPLLRVLSA